MPPKLDIFRDKLLLKSPTTRVLAERGMLGVARLNRTLGARQEGRNIVVFHAGRSGSQVLAGLLAQHPDIFWDNELFWAARQRAYRRIYGEALDPLDIVRLAPYKTRKPWYGWEVKPHHFRQMRMHRSESIRALKAMGYDRFVILQRRSLLRQFLSARLITSQEDRTRTHVRIDATPERRRIALDADDFLGWARTLENDFQGLRADLKGERILELNYEDHIEEDPREAYSLVCDFLGVPHHEAEVTLRRSNPFPLRELISNYDEFARVISGTAYAPMLQQDGHGTD
ncbi:MAG: sulfotransferase [Halioglobus sp.]